MTTIRNTHPASTDSRRQPYHFWAFISYSHQDNIEVRGDGSGDHILWANWLHDQLETYRIPDDYRQSLTRTHEAMPERFFPIFRDETELPTSHDLGGQIRDALYRSRFLIVIASPRSARSRYVNEEVRHFRELGRGDRILTFIVDGEPNVRLDPKAGWMADDECFCAALVHPLGPDGGVDHTAQLPEEPIAADVRVKNRESPREMRASDREHSDHRSLLNLMMLKVVAGLMGVRLDELVQRDKQRVSRDASRTEFLFARQLFDLGKDRPAYARLAKAIENDSKNQAAVTLGLDKIRQVNRAMIRQYVHQHSVDSAEFSPDGTRILTISEDHTAQIWDTELGLPVAPPMWHEGPITCAKFCPDGSRILTGSHDFAARLWDASTGRCLIQPMRHEGPIYSAEFDAHGARILTASEDCTARLWNADTGMPLAEPLRHHDPVEFAKFSPDGEWILTGSGHETILWSSVTGLPIGKPLLHDGPILKGAFSPDGTSILITLWNSKTRLWDAHTCHPLTAHMQHAGLIYGALMSPDGTRILTASEDHTARLWDASTGKELLEPLRHGDVVQGASFSPDGTRLLTVSGGAALLWDASSGEPLGQLLHHNRGIL